jgi:hypothetical protein
MQSQQSQSGISLFIYTRLHSGFLFKVFLCLCKCCVRERDKREIKKKERDRDKREKEKEYVRKKEI